MPDGIRAHAVPDTKVAFRARTRCQAVRSLCRPGTDPWAPAVARPETLPKTTPESAERRVQSYIQPHSETGYRIGFARRRRPGRRGACSGGPDKPGHDEWMPCHDLGRFCDARN